MSAVKNISILRLLIFILVLSPGKASGQWALFDSIMASKIDTSGYLPYYYTGSLDFNLLVAASKGYAGEIRRLVSKGADINTESADGATPLVYAASTNNVEAISTILSLNPVVDKVTKNWETPLLIAIKNRFNDVAEKLIRSGADVNYHDNRGATPLHYSALYGYLETTDILIYYDALVDTKASDGSTPLFGAVSSGSYEVTDLLLQNGSNPNEKDTEGATPYIIAAYFGDTLMMDLLSKYGADIHAVNNNRQNALDVTIQMGDIQGTRYLLRSGKWAESKDEAINPYEVASKYSRKDIISLLQQYNTPGSPGYKIDQLSVTLSSRFFLKDIYTGFSLAFRDPYRNLGFFAGCDTKIWYTSVLMKNGEDLFYQYMNRGTVAYAGVFKDLLISEKPGILNVYFSPTLAAGYSFGTILKGTAVVPSDKMKIIPEANFKFMMQNVSVSLGASYIKTDFYRNGPIWIRAGLSYNYYFDSVRKNIRPIRWYKK